MSHKRILSFKYALIGIWTAFNEEPNLKFHFFAAAVVLFFGLFFKVSFFEWVIIILLIGIVLAVELTNTAIEVVVDSFTQDTHPGAKKAKDVAAAASLVVAITSAIIGLLIFLPYINNRVSW